MKYISEESNNYFAKSILRSGDILTVRSGTPGTSSVVPKSLEGANCIDVIILSPSPLVDSRFLCEQINSNHVKRQISVGQGGLAQQHFNVGDMKNVNIYLPPKEIQEKISRTLLSINQCKDLKNLQVMKLKNLKEAISSELLSGRKRVIV